MWCHMTDRKHGETESDLYIFLFAVFSTLHFLGLCVEKTHAIKKSINANTKTVMAISEMKPGKLKL